MITRKDYMEGRATHEAYYGELVREAGISYANSVDLPRIKAALAAGDKHLNTIPLSWWDARAAYCGWALSKALRERGDYPTLAGLVCVHKAAAKIAAAQ